MNASNSGFLSPDEITNKAFDTKRRGGFDPDAVRRHLASVAATVQDLTTERVALSDQVGQLQEQLAKAEAHPVPQEELDEDALTERLGQDAARVLAEARAASADRIAEAEVLADDIRAAAEEIYAERSMRADEEANKIREGAEQKSAERTQDAEQAAAQTIATAEAEAESMRAGVIGERQSADAEAARIISEAELTRRQILEDLARRRSAARRQIEQLRAGRERLLASHETVRRALDDISEELTISMSEARAAAETAGHTVSDTTVEELEAEIETARLTGLLDTGPVPVVSSRPAAASDRVDATAAEQVTPLDVIEPPSPQRDAAEPAKPAVVAEVEPAEVTNDLPKPPSGKGLADVVQLDLARNDVDTATHPATGRDASLGRGGSSKSKPLEPVERKPPVLEAVESLKPTEPAPLADQQKDDVTSEMDVPSGIGDDDDIVGDLFASLKSAPAPKKPKPSPNKSSSKSKSTAKKSTANKSASKKSEPKTTAAPDPEIEVDSTDVARRLKRVLADEQSRAMSRVKGASQMPSLDQLLGEPSVHVERYWIEVVAQIDDPSPNEGQLRRPVDDLVDSIRRRVGEALTNAGDDSEGAVSSLRSVYREVKTQRISICADEVCRMAAGRSADLA